MGPEASASFGRRDGREERRARCYMLPAVKTLAGLTEGPRSVRIILIFAAINGFLAVLAGAMGAHALGAVLSPKALEWIATAERYQMWHAIALGLIVALGARDGAARDGGLDAPLSYMLKLAAGLFALGIVFFSGSLYVLALTGWRPIAMAAPVGGLALMAGWVALACHALTRAKH